MQDSSIVTRDAYAEGDDERDGGYDDDRSDAYHRSLQVISFRRALRYADAVLGRDHNKPHRRGVRR